MATALDNTARDIEPEQRQNQQSRDPVAEVGKPKQMLKRIVNSSTDFSDNTALL